MKHKDYDDKPTTEFILTMRYQSTVITLDDAIKHYMPHLTIDHARRKAQEQTLPFPVFKADKNSRKAPYLVRIEALAAWLDSAANEAQDDWEKVNK